MANESYIKGYSVLFSIWDTDAYEPIACVTSNTLTENVELIETRTKCNPGNVDREADAYTYEISVDGVYIDEDVDTARQSHRKLATLMRAKTTITWRLSTGITSPTAEYGTGIITSLELTGEAEGNATFTATISGIGSITSTDPEST